MQKHKVKLLPLVVVHTWLAIHLCFWILLAPNEVKASGNSESGYRSATEQDSRCLPIKREVYRLRHWQWSGGPFQGGFLPDPHFVCSNTASFPPDVEHLLGDDSARFQVIDVNPFFKDESKEIILAIESRSTLYEFKLDYFHNYSVRQAMGVGYPDVRLFRHEGGIAVLAWLDDKLRGIYFVPVPLKSGQVLPLHQVGSQEFVRVGEYFKNLPPSDELKDYFCSRLPGGVVIGSNIFISYFRKYRGDCGYRGKEPELYEDLTSYERWWGNSLAHNKN